MSKVPVCVNPVIMENIREDSEFKNFVDFETRGEFINRISPYHLEVELTDRCLGSCFFCYTASTPESNGCMPKERAMKLVDEAVELGVRQISWCGGDPTLHPDWKEILCYSADQGLDNMLATSSIVSKRLAREICSLGSVVNAVGVHISSINPSSYNQIHSNPKTLELKMQGVKNLLEAGYKSEDMWALITLSKPAVDSFPETLDWFADQMGIKIVYCLVYKGMGALDPKNADWEPGLSELQKVYEYRAKKLGSFWLKIGAGDGSFFYCRTQFGVTWDGRVDPCVCITDLSVGNIYQESLKDIVEKNRDSLLYNFKVKGYCGEECENRDICFGCRWTAYHYTGDVQASDPKCWLNPEAKEYYFKSYSE